VAAADSLIDAIKHGKSMTNFRLRYENVDQENRSETGEAASLRSLIGWQTGAFHDLSLGVQLIDVSKLQDDYDDRDLGLPQPGRTDYPIIADPDVTDVNELYLDWTGLANTRVRAGRQQVNLDNVRFIGDIGFRQVMQVFDGVSLLNKSLPATELYLAHFGRVRQISTRLREGDLDIVNAKYHLTPNAALTGYGYFSNFKNPTVGPNSVLGAGTDQSNKTLGLRLDGGYQLDAHWKLLYTAEYARQTDYADGDTRIDAYYTRLGGGIMSGAMNSALTGSWYARLDYELLSSNNSQYAFQTPFGTNHLFQGWADLFLVTPVQGIKDRYLSFGGKPLAAVQLSGEYHVFKSDEAGIDYGKELDLALAYSINAKLFAKLEYANFKEDDQLAGLARKPDTEKIWLTMMYTF
jgi:hypothetical protein